MVRKLPIVWFAMALVFSLIPARSVTYAAPVNEVPNVVPSIQQWTGGSGYYQLNADSRIVIETANSQVLSDTAKTLQEDLKLITGKNPSILSGMSAKAGDIYLALSGADAGLGDEGYEMNIADSVSIKANKDDGIFYGTRTLLQIMKQNSSSQAPQGSIRDVPRQKERGIMLDTGRHFYAMDSIEDTIKRLSWNKMNTLHMHFSEWNGFRLESETYPGLTSNLHYSKADIRRMQDIGKKYHVEIVPEIDLPAHASTMTRYNPKLNFQCTSMNNGWGQTGWTIDITKSENRQWIHDLLEEFIPLFDSKYFHIGTDEYQIGSAQTNCQELVAYAQQRGFQYTNDVFIDWMNEVNDQVKSHGKTTQAWSWWDYGGQKYSIMPDKDIVLNVWKDVDPSWILNQGYTVVSIPEPILYVTPGLGLSVNLKNIYENWVPFENDRLNGYRMAVWSDNSESETDAFFEGKSKKARQVLAERLWGGPRSATVEQFFERVQKIGDAPGVAHPEQPEPLGITVVENDAKGTGINQIEYAGGGWGHGSDSYSKTTDAYYQIRFSGSQIKIWGAKDPKHGIAGISLDGGPETEVDLYASSRNNQYIYASPILAAKEHTLKVRVTGKKNAAASDVFVVIDRADITNRLVVENAVKGTGLQQLDYKGSWKIEGDSYSKAAGDYVQMRFSGKQVIVYGAKGPLHGIAAVSIDGGAEQLIDLYAPARQSSDAYYVSPVLASGEHVVKIRVTGEKNTSATDRFVVMDWMEVVPGEAQAVTGVALNKSSVTLQPGQSEQLSAIIAPENASNREVVWKSSDEKVAAVDDNGLVSALSEGTALVTVRTKDQGKEAAANILVSGQETDEARAVINAPKAVKADESFTVGIGLQHLTAAPVQALDMTIRYDGDKFEYVGTDSAREAVELIQVSAEKQGELRMIAAAAGSDHAIRTDGPVIELKLKAKAADDKVTGTIAIGKVVLGDPEGAETVAAVSTAAVDITPGDATGASGDLNGDGKVSIGDLGIVASHYGKDSSSPDWEQAKRADINGDGRIDIADLAAIAKKMME